MSGNATTCICSDSFSEKQQVLMWVVKWISNNHDHRKNASFDVVDLVQLLRCAGFHLQSLDQNYGASAGGGINIQITCGKSGLTATMTSTAICTCVPPDLKNTADTKTAVFLPQLNPTKQTIAADILSELIYVFLRSDGCGNKCVEASGSTKGNAGQNWEMDSGTSPPKDTSSPIADNCEDKNKKLQNNLKQISAIVTSSLELVKCKDTTFVLDSNKKWLPDIKPATPQNAAAVVKSPYTLTPAVANLKKIASRVGSFRTKAEKSPSQLISPRRFSGGSNLVRQVSLKRDEKKSAVGKNVEELSSLLKTRRIPGLIKK